MEIKRVGIYCRVSTKDQSVETQMLELRRYSGLRGWQITSEHSDEGWSGTKDVRPGLDAIMQMARQGEFDALLVWKQDRLARSLPHFFQVFNELKAVGIAFVSYKEGVNTADEDNPYSRFYMKMMASFAELEREMILERTQSGRQRVIDVFEQTGKIDTKSGVWFGRPRLAVDDVIQEYAERFRNGQVKLAEVAAAAGCSKPTACRRLKAFHKSPQTMGLFPDEAGVGI
ncbi:MAG: hypothetical protein DMF62_02525 [Acidobacteria bacterium]|nr:MAG: hypothetical protein DMF62_02525 [Acidobacteriota bacterium]